MTSYLDDTWLQEELQRFEASKKNLLAAAALLERANAAVPQLQRSLEQLEKQERQTKKNLEQLSESKSQELSALVAQGQETFDTHVQQVLNRLQKMGEAGQVLQLRQEVTGLLQTIPVLEQQAAHLTEEIDDLGARRTVALEQQMKETQETLSSLLNQQTTILEKQTAGLSRLNQLSIQEDAFKQALSQLLANQQELQKTQQQLQTYQQTQGGTIQRTVQQISELENSSIRRHKELETQFSERLAASQAQLQESLMTQLGVWRTESQQAQQQLSQRLDKLTTLPEHLTSMDSTLKETQKSLETHRKETAARHEGQREALSDLESQMKAGQSRAARFIAWFEKAGALARMSGKPE